MKLTIERLHKLVHYDPETGDVIWKAARKYKLEGKKAGYLGSKGYWRVSIDGKEYLAQRLIWFWMTGRWPYPEAEHRDTNKLNNKWGNLREATRSQNCANKKAHVDNKLGIKGVDIHNGKYRARIFVNKEWVHLGYRAIAEEASALYALAAIAHFGEFARVR